MHKHIDIDIYIHICVYALYICIHTYVHMHTYMPTCIHKRNVGAKPTRRKEAAVSEAHFTTELHFTTEHT